MKKIPQQNSVDPERTKDAERSCDTYQPIILKQNPFDKSDSPLNLELSSSLNFGKIIIQAQRWNLLHHNKFKNIKKHNQIHVKKGPLFAQINK